MKLRANSYQTYRKYNALCHYAVKKQDFPTQLYPGLVAPKSSHNILGVRIIYNFTSASVDYPLNYKEMYSLAYM